MKTKNVNSESSSVREVWQRLEEHKQAKYIELSVKDGMDMLVNKFFVSFTQQMKHWNKLHKFLAPRAPQSAYQYFRQTCKAKILIDDPSTSSRNIQKMISAKWKAVPTKNRKAMETKEKIRYETEKKNIVERHLYKKLISLKPEKADKSFAIQSVKTIICPNKQDISSTKETKNASLKAQKKESVTKLRLDLCKTKVKVKRVAFHQKIRDSVASFPSSKDICISNLNPKIDINHSPMCLLEKQLRLAQIRGWSNIRVAKVKNRKVKNFYVQTVVPATTSSSKAVSSKLGTANLNLHVKKNMRFILLIAYDYFESILSVFAAIKPRRQKMQCISNFYYLSKRSFYEKQVEDEWDLDSPIFESKLKERFMDKELHTILVEHIKAGPSALQKKSLGFMFMQNPENDNSAERRVQNKKFILALQMLSPGPRAHVLTTEITLEKLKDTLEIQLAEDKKIGTTKNGI